MPSLANTIPTGKTQKQGNGDRPTPHSGVSKAAGTKVYGSIADIAFAVKPPNVGKVPSTVERRQVCSSAENTDMQMKVLGGIGMR